MTQTLGLYIHIPFCAEKCGYCDFYSLPAPGKSLMDRYQKALIKHLKEAAPFTTGYSVDTVYFGGGTPSFFGEKRLIKLLGTIKKRFPLIQLAEITVEANPESSEPKTLSRLRKAGFNRISIGVQSCDDEILKTIGRVHDTQTAIKAIKNAKAAGFGNISVDLIFGLPGQTKEGFLSDLKALIAMEPQHFSCYALKLSEDCRLYAERGRHIFMVDDEQADLYLSMVQELERAGYMQYEISNFAKKGYESRHNQKYWTLSPYLGFGPSAHSDFSKRRYSFVRDVEGYIEGVMTGSEIMDEFEEIEMTERALEYLMLGMRTSRGVSGNEYTRLFRASFAPIEKTLALLEKHGFSQPEGDRWRLTAKGFLVSNAIIGEILDRVQREADNPGGWE